MSELRNIKKEISISEVEVIIQNKMYDYYKKYHKEAKYVKLPLWLVQGLKYKMAEIQTLNIEYSTGLIKWFNLCICETISIENIEEIEVF